LDDVSTIENYIVLDHETRSELVVPCFGKGNKLKCVINLESENLSMFDEVDREEIEKIIKLVYDGEKSRDLRSEEEKVDQILEDDIE